jgi:hypothetical protein
MVSGVSCINPNMAVMLVDTRASGKLWRSGIQ